MQKPAQNAKAMTSLNESLNRLETAAAKLNEQSDEVNEWIANVNQRLIDAQIGIELWLTDTIADYWHLGFCKFKNGWSLATRDTILRRPHPLSSSASRKVRFAAVRLIPRLIEGLTERAVELSKKIEDVGASEWKDEQP